MTSQQQPVGDRRQQQRWNLVAPVSVSLRETGQLLGHAVNLSLRGMLVVGEVPIELNRCLEVDLEIPGDNGQWRKTPFMATAVRTYPEPDDPTLHNTGFHIEYVEPASLFALQRLIHELETFG